MYNVYYFHGNKLSKIKFNRGLLLNVDAGNAFFAIFVR